MINYIFRKASILFLSLLLVITITFFLMHTIPGDPFMEDQAIPEEVLKALHRHYGLDEPLVVQYIKYLKGILFFDFGPSLKYQGRTVNQIISEGFPVSFLLGFESLTIALIGGVALGSLASFFIYGGRTGLF